MSDGRDDERPRDHLTEREIEKLRAMIPQLEHVIEEEEFAARFWATVRKGIYYAAAAIGGVALFRENLKQIWLWLIK